MTSHRNDMAVSNDVGFHKLELGDSSTRRRKPSTCEGINKAMFIALLLVTGVVIVILIVFILYIKSSESHICMTPECVHVAAEILDKYDPDVDPCEDFYRFSCGSWMKKTVLDDDQQQINTMGVLRNDIIHSLKGLVEEPVSEEDAFIVQQVKHYYVSCTNLSRIEARGDVPAHNLIREFGGWPVLDPNWDPSNFDLETLFAKLLLLDTHAIIGMMVYADPGNATDNVIRFYPGTLGMGKDTQHFRNGLQPSNTKLHAYLNASIQLATVLGADPDRARDQMTDMVRFEVELARLGLDRNPPPVDTEEETDDTAEELPSMFNDTVPIFSNSQRLTVGDLADLLGETFDVYRYLKLIFDNVSVAIDHTEQVRVLMSFELVQRALQYLRAQPKGLLQNYLVWRAIVRMVGDLPQRFKDILIGYNKEMYGISSLPPRWETCVKNMNQLFAMATGRIFVNKHFHQDAKTEAADMIAEVQHSFSESLKTLNWMDDITRIEAIKKAEGLEVKVGYPDYILDDQQLRDHYPGLELDPECAFENALKLHNTNAQRLLRTLHLVSRRDEWSDVVPPSAVTAGYLRYKNQIAFPAAILQPPLFHKGYPKCVNYGSIGVVIGHEITHGFGIAGRNYDRNGNFRNWFSNISALNFDNTSDCFRKQFDEYIIPEVGRTVDGVLTAGENIADTGGLKLSLQAYDEWVRRRGNNDYLLPGLPYSHKQLFFLAFGQMWCDVSRPKFLESSRTWDPHSPNRFRVIGTLSNSPAFAEAFACPKKSPMNPKRKCSMW